MAESKTRKYSFIGGFLFVAVIITAVVFFWGKPTLDIDPQVGRAIEPPRPFPPFSLVDQQGEPFKNDRLIGHWSIAMIGFTYCPDVCPTTVSNVAAFFKSLSRQFGDDSMPQFIFFSVDPFRDTPEVLGNYIEYYHEDFIGVTGKPVHIHDLVKKLDLFYAYTDPKDNHMLADVLTQPTLDDYGVMHSTRLLFISPDSELVASMSWPYTPESILKFYSKLRKYHGG